jgi:hypothetical protein
VADGLAGHGGPEGVAVDEDGTGSGKLSHVLVHSELNVTKLFTSAIYNC